jgi:hypothetical protein
MQTVYEVSLKGWHEKYYFAKLEVAKQFGEKFVAEGYKSYEVKGITLREEI